MRKLTKSILMLTCALGVAGTLLGCGTPTNEDEYTKDGKLKLSLRNLYFDDYAGGDSYTEEIENMFKISIEPQSYSWSDWSTQVNGQILAQSVPDVFHANIDSYNFASYYKYWAEEGVTKQLPDDLSKWPHLADMIAHTTNIDSLKLNGHLYGIPIAKNTTDYSTTFSPFTYIYRRDWAKQFGVYQENDEYTWEQFQTLLAEFTRRFAGTSSFALGDVEWGFPSITNFYKQVPHCFAKDATTGKYVNNYTTPEYLQGLEMSKTFKNNGWYGYPQYSAVDGELNTKYYGNTCGVLYENLSYSNFVTLKNQLKKTNASNKDFNIDDAMAIMKIKGPDGKYVLEGTDNWFSMTFLDAHMSETKMNKILDLIDWLLSEEGTRFAIYGIEDYDYYMEGDEVVLVEEYWKKDNDGLYVPKNNGGKYLRCMASLGYDTLTYDPVTDKEAVAYLDAWDAEMRTALAAGNLKVLKEDAEVMWMTTPLKAENSGTLRTQALANVTKYIYDDIKTTEEFVAKVENRTWTQVLDEINTALGK